MKAYGVKDNCDSNTWLRVGKSSFGSPRGKNGKDIRAYRRNGVVKKQLRRNMKRTERQNGKDIISNQLYNN